MSPRTPQQFKEMRDQSRIKIITAAKTIFSEYGTIHATMEMIAKEAGISKGLIYNYYHSKDEIIEKIIEECVMIFDKIYQEQPNEENPKKQLKNLINSFFRSLEEDFYHWNLYHSIVIQPQINNKFQKMLYEYAKSFFSYTHEIFEKIYGKDGIIEVKFLSSMLDGIAFDYIMFRENYPLDEIEQKVYDLYQISED